MLDDVWEEVDMLHPLDEVFRWDDSLALGCFIKLIERLPCPWLRLRFFLKSRKNTDFRLEGVNYGLSPCISSVWEVKQCLTSSTPSYFQKHISANSIIYLHHPPPKFVNMRKMKWKSGDIYMMSDDIRKSESEWMCFKNMHVDFIEKY
ncbi:hypothetical protein QL285_096561 [Trifolium repens]|nr:hypothetical protein QL285_096561 [Trifolium repens]